MGSNVIDRTAIADLTSGSIEAKIEEVRAAAAETVPEAPRLQFSCYYVRVADVPGVLASAHLGLPMFGPPATR